MKELGYICADITALSCDAIVNAANSSLLGGGGVDGAIHERAGPELLAACLALPEVSRGVRCLAGSAKITEAFELPSRYVIHAVGPIWSGNVEDSELLAFALQSALALAELHELHSVAVPAISSGAFGFPIDQAARILSEVSRAFLPTSIFVERIVFCLFEPEVELAFSQHLEPLDASTVFQAG